MRGADHLPDLNVWKPANKDFWHYWQESRPRIAFLAPPLDTIPSPSGSAIYSLVEQLVQRMSLPAVAMSIGPTSHTEQTAIADRLLYFTGKLKRRTWQRCIPYRFRKRMFGAGAPEFSVYGETAGRALNALGISVVVAEDVPIVCRGLQKAPVPIGQVLHQHCNAPSTMPTNHWRSICRQLKGVAFVCRRALDQTCQIHGPLSVPSRVVYNGVDTNHYDPRRWNRVGEDLRNKLGFSEDMVALLFVGRLLPHKGVVEAAQAFIQANLSKARMLITGDLGITTFRNDAYIRKLEQVAAASAGRIQLIGNVSQAQIPAYYAAADAVIVPSLGPEGLPKVITEALAMGKPVLATDCGGSWELLKEQENGWLISNGHDSAQMASLLRSVLSSRTRLQTLSEVIIQHDRSFMSEERMVAEFGQMLEEWCPARDVQPCLRS